VANPVWEEKQANIRPVLVGLESLRALKWACWSAKLTDALTNRAASAVIREVAKRLSALSLSGRPLVACAMRQSITGEAAGAPPSLGVEQMEKLFLSLA
jgi:hypothetical protein